MENYGTVKYVNIATVLDDEADFDLYFEKYSYFLESAFVLLSPYHLKMDCRELFGDKYDGIIKELENDGIYINLT